eukprot:1192047-Prorocentrum_minimum.AAC.2
MRDKQQRYRWRQTRTLVFIPRELGYKQLFRESVRLHPTGVFTYRASYLRGPQVTSTENDDGSATVHFTATVAGSYELKVFESKKKQQLRGSPFLNRLNPAEVFAGQCEVRATCRPLREFARWHTNSHAGTGIRALAQKFARLGRGPLQGNRVDVKGNLVDVKGNRVDVKGNRVDVKGNRVDFFAADGENSPVLLYVRCVHSFTAVLTLPVRLGRRACARPRYPTSVSIV